MQKNYNMLKAALLLVFIILIQPLIISANEQQSEEKLWELNFAAGIISMPHYIGSDQRYTMPLGIPYLIYRGEILQVDKHGIRSRFFENENLSIDLDFSFGLPVHNNGARIGMPDLGLVGQIGPQLNWSGFKDHDTEISLHLPLRIAFDMNQSYLGWVCEPGIRLEQDLGNNEKYTLNVEGEILYASKQYGDYYYGVAPQYATLTRPAYQAQEGVHYVSLKTGLGVRHNPNLLSGIFISLKKLTSGAVSDSPLVKKNFYFSIGFGMTWTFMTSDESVLK